jgi:hypothetical protein
MAHTRIGQLARMPAVGTGRIDLKILLQPALPCDMLHDAVGCRGAADIAEADKKYFRFHADKDSESRAAIQNLFIALWHFLSHA